MAARRFSNVLRGYRGAAAKQKLLDHYEGVGQGAGVGGGTKRDASVKLYIEPFGADFPTGLYVTASAGNAAWTALKAVGAISARTLDVLGATATALPRQTLKPARVVRRSKADRTGARQVSKLTGLAYLQYKNPSISAPFGRDNATDTYAEARTAIANGITTAFAVTFIDENF